MCVVRAERKRGGSFGGKRKINSCPVQNSFYEKGIKQEKNHACLIPLLCIAAGAGNLEKEVRSVKLDI